MTIRPARPNELATQDVTTLISLAMFKPDEKRLAAFLTRIDFRTSVAYVAELGGRLVGMAVAARTDARTVAISSIAILESDRRKGVGSALVAHMVAHHPASTFVAETDDDAVGFYAALGFEIHPLGEKYPGVNRYRCVLRGS